MAKRANIPRPRCGGEWTEARYTSFIKGLLRAGMLRWAPKIQAKKNAEVGKEISAFSGRMSMHYLCSQCGAWYPSKGRVEGKPKPINLIMVDHILPTVDPATGIISWDDVIDRMFVEEEGFQVLCYKCHHVKTQEERAIMYERKRKEELDGR